MGRKNVPIYCRDEIYYARWYDEQGRKIAFSLDTSDFAEAIRRYPYVRNSQMGYNQFLKSGLMGNELSAAVDTTKLDLDYQRTIQRWRNDVRAGRAYRESAPESPYGDGQLRWRYRENPTTPIDVAIANFPDESEAMRKFFLEIVPTLFLDRVQTDRNVKLWIRFMDENNVISWQQIDEKLMSDYNA